MYTIDPSDIDPSLPQPVKDFLAKGGQIEEIRLSATGIWTHENLPIEHPRIQEAFSQNIYQTEHGQWMIRLGKFVYPVVVEECGFFVESLAKVDGQGQLTLSDKTQEILDISTLFYVPQPDDSSGRLYCRIKNGQYLACFKRPAYYQLFEYCEETEDGIRVHLGEGHLLEIRDTPNEA